MNDPARRRIVSAGHALRRHDRSVHGLPQGAGGAGHDVHVYTTSVDGDADSPVPHGEPGRHRRREGLVFQSRGRRIICAGDAARWLRDSASSTVVHTHAIYPLAVVGGGTRRGRAGVPYMVSPRGMLEKDLIEQKSPLLKADVDRASSSATTSSAPRPSTSPAPAKPMKPRPFGFHAAACGDSQWRRLGPPGGLRRRRRSPPIINGRPYVLFLGRINWKKGLDRLIAALAHARRRRLMIAGNDDEGYRPTLDDLEATRGAGDRVTFPGRFTAPTRRRCCPARELLVLPSYSENFGNVVLEAMAAGWPVIVTPEVGIAPIGRDDRRGPVVPTADPRSWSRAIATRRRRSRRRHEWAARPGRRGDAILWPAVAAQMETLYQSVAAEGARVNDITA